MSIKYSFFDNQEIGVDDLNKITSRLITEGVAREPSSVSDLNSFIADIATAGVVPETNESLKVTVENGIATINEGVAIFQNGTVIEISGSETIPYVTDKKQYVYLISDITSNRAYIEISEDIPEFENKVLIAEISGDTVTDKRTYSRGKLAYYGSSDVNNNVYVEAEGIEKAEVDDEGYINYRINVNADMYNYIQIIDKNGINFTRYNIKDESYLCFGYGYNSYYALNESYIIAAAVKKLRCVCKIEKGDGFVNFRFKMERNYEFIPLSLRFEFLQ